MISLNFLSGSWLGDAAIPAPDYAKALEGCENNAMNTPIPPIPPRRRLQELLAIPERQRTDEQWDEINELEIKLASANREDAPDPSMRRDGSSNNNNRRNRPPGGGQQGKRPPRKFHNKKPGGPGGGPDR